MLQAIMCLFILLMAYGSFRDAKRRGVWSWSDFFVVIGMIVVFSGLMIVPAALFPRLQKEPALLTTIMLTVILAMVGTMMYWFRKKAAKANTKST